MPRGACVMLGWAGAGMSWNSGEHLQWGDVLYTLLELGHKIFVPGKYEWQTWKDYAWNAIDIIITDYGGISDLQASFPGEYKKLRCKLRVLDTWGTSARQLRHPNLRLAPPS